MRRATLTPAQKRKLLRDGYVPVPGIVPRPLVEAALKEIHCLVAESNQEAGAGAFSGSQFVRHHGAPAILDLFYKTPLRALAESLAGKGALELPREGHVYLRFPQRERRAGSPPLHIDGAASPEGGPATGIGTMTQKLCVLLSDAPRPFCGNFTVCPGSHRLVARRLSEQGAESLLRRLPDVAGLRPRQLLGRAGDAFVCHQLLVHSGQQNLSAYPRYAVFFNLRHVDHLRRWARAVTDPWLEWPGLSGRGR